MITDLNKIVKEWGYRVDNSKPDPMNSTHQYKLYELLIEYKWPLQVIDELIENLNEVDIVQKKSISTFTATHEDESLAKGRGVQTGMGGIICYVEGHVLAQRSMDFDTTPDKQGRRWVSAFHVFDKKPEIWAKALKASKVDFDSIDGKLGKIERDLKDKWIEGDIKYDDYKAKVKEEQGPIVAKYIKDFINVANKTLIKNKKIFKKSLIDSDVNKRTAWWNEIVVYNTKIIDMFVMQRVLDNSVLAKVEIERLLSTASGNKPITIGAPAQFRKWFKERKGKIHKG
jgi:hypothetical protein